MTNSFRVKIVVKILSEGIKLEYSETTYGALQKLLTKKSDHFLAQTFIQTSREFVALFSLKVSKNFTAIYSKTKGKKSADLWHFKSITFGYPLFCNFRNRKSYKIRVFYKIKVSP